MDNAINYVDTGANAISDNLQNAEVITYEYPLNDASRICLRLEGLFEIIDINLDTPTPSASRLVLTSTLEILNVIDRPDLKSKLTQTLTQYQTTFNALQKNPQIEQETLATVLTDINDALKILRQMHGKVGDKLRKNQFLNTIKMHLNQPGGPCDYSTPAFALWLHQDVFSRKQQVTTWLEEFANVRAVASLILQLTRNSAAWEGCDCDKGFYQQKLDQQSTHNMLRIQVPVDLQVIPEFSVGKHRFSVRMMSPNFKSNGQPSPYKKDFEFALMVCRV